MSQFALTRFCFEGTLFFDTRYAASVPLCGRGGIWTCEGRLYALRLRGESPLAVSSLNASISMLCAAYIWAHIGPPTTKLTLLRRAC